MPADGQLEEEGVGRQVHVLTTTDSSDWMFSSSFKKDYEKGEQSAMESTISIQRHV